MSSIGLLIEVLKEMVEDAKVDLSLLQEEEYWKSGTVIRKIPVSEITSERYKPLYFRDE